MLLSMTGYGRGNVNFNGKSITIEIRSLNSKYTDIRLKIPQNYKEKEHELRKILSDKAERGKLDLSIDIKSVHGGDDYGLNSTLFKKYYTELSKISSELDMPKGDLMQAILKLPNVVAAEEESIDDQEWKTVLEGLQQSIDHFMNFRTSEGKAMEQDLRMRTSNIMGYLEKLDPYETERISRLRQRLRQNLEDHLGKENVDENRFEQEIIFYLEKIDLTEEKVRLEQHCKYFIEELDKNIVQKGRKLSFISQEMGREINTLGAKAYSSEIQKLVVCMKDELEKIKEQVANSV